MILEVKSGCYECGGSSNFYTTDVEVTSELIDKLKKAHDEWYKKVYCSGLTYESRLIERVKFFTLEDRLVEALNLQPITADITVNQ